ncbi:glycosyltransferase family 2 protein [Proteiniphilum sp. X52]|uniref:glycosyltransferase family 2 protein n=1 Tax=Proteiniphilum sp. X52 TaxID=2382159 RepID=UPI000F0A52D6|nr:glycosyltransferase family 2 protein [Proteiniphilum sp. X52]RNC66123.1 glycosyltransferase [Proteiniphilum sp. X52]
MMKLSVITVTFNAEETLERTLKSVQEQTYPDLEHLIVDGASRDGTGELVHKYAKGKGNGQEGEVTAERKANAEEKMSSHTQLRWVSEPDRGLYDAMNKAIGMASGDYLCFLNAGDTFHSPDTVEKMMHSLDTNQPPDILYGETAIVDDRGTFLHMRRLQAPEKLNWKSFKQGMLVCHQAFIVKRELAEPYDLSYRFSSDFDWCIRMMKKATSIHNTRLTLINYLNEGTTTANRKASLKERYRIMAKYYGQISTFSHHVWFVIRTVLK